MQFHMIKANYLIQAYNKREKWEGFSVEPGQTASKKNLQNAIKSYAPDVNPEEIVLFCNANIMGSGKKGFLITERAIYGTIGNQISKDRDCKCQDKSANPFFLRCTGLLSPEKRFHFRNPPSHQTYRMRKP